MNRTYNFLLFNKKLFKVFLLGLLVFTFFRIFFMIRFGNLQTFSGFYNDIPLLFFNGLRFDLQSLAYIFLIFLILNSVLLFYSSDQLVKMINKASITLIPVFLIISILLMIADQQFYSFFKFHFNVVTFDFFDEEPKQLLKSIWSDHPIILIFSTSIALFFLIRYLVKKIFLTTTLNIKKWNLFPRIIVITTIFIVYFLFVRGSVGTFPLQMEDTNISENEFINISVPNALYSLKNAYVDLKREFKVPKPESVLKKYKYKSIEEALSVYRNIPLDSVQISNIDDLIFSESHINKKGKKYNVIYILMESMSNHFLNFHNSKCNLLGSLEPHFNQDIVFRNFQSSGNGTIYTLENIILNSPFHPLFNSKYRFVPFDISIAKPFKDAGYKTSFITGIELGWRNLDETLKRQYFDDVQGKINILKNYSKAKTNDTWGVYDHSVFDYIFIQLQKSNEPMFIMSLTSTNHTPYELPSEYTPYPIDQSVIENEEICVGIDQCMEVLTAYQYSNDALGKFLDKIKNSKLKENTIVIATGDHNSRAIISYNTPEMMVYKFSVPFYLYVPDELKKELFIDTRRWASHNDIISSIYPYILSNIKYPNLGQNIFNKDIPFTDFYSLNDDQILYADSSEVENIDKRVKARNAVVEYYYSVVLNNSKVKKQ